MARTAPTQTQAAAVDASSTASRLDGIPPLSYRALTTEREKQDALRLVVDSIAQQRQVASAAVISHPACLAALAGMCAAAWRLYAHQGLGTLVTMLCGVGIVYLSTTRYFTAAYIQRAEAFRWKSWIGGGEEDHHQEQSDIKEEHQHRHAKKERKRDAREEDTVLAAVYGQEIIGALVLRLEAPRRRGLIRAWTTKARYRGKGVGSDLLQLAARTTRERLGPGAGVDFAADHANSVNPLHDMFNGPFRRRGERARRALADAVGGMDAAS
ncbi:hypothetical protein ESCO_006443 [Escovopsis weberi]|uniref:N-acetyltransferase domain-containing protein n=1 Tax=Escovopsis weberi TaxID=150374 RepID=A0A0M9VSC1_ESCWE|nr:hypothetical protein ESCO_006443 [Escovopsis weberi]